ncbi:MAG: pentapeptide repeat-containing protein, partial [Cyanobacteria bacterium P01_C01_bin.72]
ADLGGADLSGADLSGADLSGGKLGFVDLSGANLIGVEYLTLFQIKIACNWEQAIYKGNWNSENSEWIVDEQVNQQYIEKIKQDKASDPPESVNCSKWDE